MATSNQQHQQQLEAFLQELEKLQGVALLEQRQPQHENGVVVPRVDFELIGTGRVGQVELKAVPYLQGSVPYSSPNAPPTLSLGTRGMFGASSIAEKHKKAILRNYFEPNEALEEEDQSSLAAILPLEAREQGVWPTAFALKEVFHLEASRPTTTIRLLQQQQPGAAAKEATTVAGSSLLEEVEVLEPDNTSTNSTSLSRAPGQLTDFHRGSSSNYPFMPGGIREPHEHVQQRPRTDASALLVLDGKKEGLHCIAPGFQHGLLLSDETAELVSASERPPHNTVIMEANDEEKIKQTPTEKEKEGQPKDEFEEKEDFAEDEGVTPTLQRRPSLEDVLLTGLERGTAGLARTLKKKQEEEVWAVIENMDVSNFHELVPEMALEYPFDLDIFQKQAVYHLENNESVFVAAHTSAGKTVVAEYAIALAAKHMTRTIYTSPIKALSNQKFRDFRETFGDVGLITGDVSIRPEAACLIVTTEILRSMLYKGADLIRDVEWVIFDEVHYVNDLERGVVWEEVIIMLPDHVNLILLSATVPNTFEFADWIGRTKKKNIYVISTSKRPVPLEHYLYVNDELHKIVDSRGRYMSEGYQAALNSIKEQQAKEGHLPKQQFALTKTRQQRSRWMRMINMLKQKALLPVVVFAFSKKRCEELAYSLTTVDLTTAQEKHYTHIFMEQSLSRLKGSDRRLPQVMRIKDLLKRGIGVHHGGLLPIVKEMVEILFSRGRVKVLFATETFAMGVNMPARTVVYENTRKHDGRAFRDLYPGEYTQMSGRAGRRGLDTVGIVIINIKDDQLPENSDLHKMLLGKPQELESRFRLTYTMILNLLRVQEFKVEDMMKRSFSEFNTQRTVPQQEKMLQQCEKEVMELQGQKMEAINRNPDIEEYFATCREKQHLDAELQRMVMSSRQAIQTLTTGRVVRVKTPSSPQNGCLAVILKSLAKNTYFTDSFAGDGKEDRQFHAVVLENKGMASVSKIDSSDITELYSMRLKDVDPSRFIPFTDQNALRTLAQQLGKLQGGRGGKGGRLEALHPIKDLKINDFEFVDFYTRRESIAEQVEHFDCRRSPTLKQDYAVLEREDELMHQIQKARLALSNESLHLMPEFQQRIAVLGTLYYIDHNNTVLLKGRVARELNTVRDELIATELIFNNTLTDLPPEAIVALLSALIFELKTEVELKLPEMLVQARKEMEDLAEHLLLIQQECGLVLDPRDYLKNLNFGLMEVVFEWARGMPFADICKLTDVPEGSVVRSIVRLDETCREVRNAARIIGNSVLYAKMEKASTMIKRDIVFASSLYYDK